MIKNILLFSLLTSFCFPLFGVQAQEDFPGLQYKSFFAEAYEKYPGVPYGYLEAVAFTKTRMQHIRPQAGAQSCIGMPQVYGIMGLVEDGKGYFTNNLELVAAYSGFSKELIKSDPRMNILAYAAAFQARLELLSPFKDQIRNWFSIENRLSELPELDQNLQNGYAFHSHFFEILRFMDDRQNQKAYGFPSHNLNIEEFFGHENFSVLSAKFIKVSENRVVSSQGHEFTPLKATGPDYGPALWDPAPSCNWSSRSGTSISAVTIHTVQGSYAGAISWFKNCNSNVSAHYVIRSSDGQVTQMVEEKDKAWHVGSENPYTIGIEHEGFVNDASWYSNEMYSASADLAIDIIQSGYGINGLKTYAGPPTTGLLVLGTNCTKIKGHQHFPNQSHVDPGPNWDWDRYYRMINGSPSATQLSSCSGTFYDGGGANVNYADQERSTWLISPAGASSITLTFSTFDTEQGYDYLYVYDGGDENGTLLGKFAGTSIPGPFTANSGKIFLEFRSDCATTKAGWQANWTCASNPSTCPNPSGFSVNNLNAFGATINWLVASNATSYEVRYRHSLQSSWTTVTSNTNSAVLTGLASDALYYWQVRCLCGASTSSWGGTSFNTINPGNHTTLACSGNFLDSGGDVGNYTNLESYSFTISPPGASTVSLSFSQFDLENNFDFLTIFDGPTTSSSQLGSWTGSNSPGTISSTGNSITIEFTSDSWTATSGWVANWQCGYNQAPNTQVVLNSDWVSTSFNAFFYDTDNSGGGIDQRFYQVIDYDGQVWDANRDNGFVYETFDGSWNSGWTVGSGSAYLLNNTLHQTDTIITNTNWYIDVAQDTQTAWLYSWKGRMWNGSTNRRFGLHLFSDNPAASNRGNSYLVWFRGDNQTVEIYETVNNVLNLRTSQNITLDPFVWYDFKTTYVPQSGELKVYQEDQLVASWTDTSPIISGGYVSLRSNQAHCDFDNVRVFKSRKDLPTNPNDQMILVGPASSNDVRFMSPNPTSPAGRLFSQVIDGNENWSNLDQKDIYVDWTPPSDPVVSDGVGIDIDTTYSGISLSANWTSSVDTNSGILEYFYSIGSTPGGTDIVGISSNGDSTSVTINGLGLSPGNWYYVSVFAHNLAELPSNSVGSDGVLFLNPVGFEEASEFKNMVLYPVPARERIRGKISGGQIVRVEILRLSGAKIDIGGIISGSTFEANLVNLASGLYFVRIIDSNGNGYVGKFLKE